MNERCDNGHPLVAELAASGARDEVIMSIAGPSRAPRSRVTPVCGWKRNGILDEIATRQCTAAERRTQDAERRERAGR